MLPSTTWATRSAADPDPPRDGRGGECTGTVIVGVPHDQGGHPPIDSGGVYVDFPTVAALATGPAVGPAVHRPAKTVRPASATVRTPSVKADPSRTPDRPSVASPDGSPERDTSKASGNGNSERGDKDRTKRGG